MGSVIEAQSRPSAGALAREIPFFPSKTGHLTNLKIAPLADVSVNDGRFPRSGDVYHSPNYDTSERKVEIDAETGMGALKIM